MLFLVLRVPSLLHLLCRKVGTETLLPDSVRKSGRPDRQSVRSLPPCWLYPGRPDLIHEDPHHLPQSEAVAS